MRMKTGVLLAAFCLLPLVALADTFRCGKWVITEDVTVSELTSKCGPPSARESRTEDIKARNQYGLRVKTGETTTEIWTYDRGSSAAAMVVTIVDGEVTKIERKRD